jgi:hypothetical protein
MVSVYTDVTVDCLLYRSRKAIITTATSSEVFITRLETCVTVCQVIYDTHANGALEAN